MSERSSLMRYRTVFLAVIPCLVLSCGLARGQSSAPGVSGDSIKIGSCLALDGPASFLGLQMKIGATAYFSMVNGEGGVNGRKLELVTYDDGYDPEKTAACFERLQKAEIFSGAFFVGTPTAAKYIPMAEEAKLPIVGLFTGAQILYEPHHKYIVNVRASYYDETRAQVDGLWEQLGMRKIAVLYQDDAFGKAVLEGVKRALARHHAEPAALGTFERNTLNVDEGMKSVRAANPEAVVLVGPYAPVAAILKRARAEGWHTRFLTVSFVGTEGLLRAAPQDSDGLIITQVVPPYDRTDLPTVKLYRDALVKYMGNTQPSFVSLEGFVDAMVLVDGLRAAGRDLTRDKLISSLEAIHGKDIGLGPKLILNFSATDHKGLDTVYTTVIDHGKPIVVSDWKKLPQN